MLYTTVAQLKQQSAVLWSISKFN